MRWCQHLSHNVDGVSSFISTCTGDRTQCEKACGSAKNSMKKQLKKRVPTILRIKKSQTGDETIL